MSRQTALSWIEEGKRFIGLKEINSKHKHDETLLQWLKNMGRYSNESRAWWADDETPWCGLFVGHTLGVCGRYVVKNWFRAQAWNDADKMTRLSKPAYGCIVTFTRAGGGHVGFVVGKDRAGNLLVLGGNQNNRVSIAAFPLSRVTGYWWPSRWQDGACHKSTPLAARYNLPIGTAVLSRNEA